MQILTLKGQLRRGGAPGARTQNPRIKRRPLHRSERTACVDVPRQCTEAQVALAVPGCSFHDSFHGSQARRVGAVTERG
jgi:hypothetical protein